MYKTSSGACAAFLANINTQDATVKFNGMTYQLPGWSVSILPDCKNVAFNTAQVHILIFNLLSFSPYWHYSKFPYLEMTLLITK